MQEFRCLDVIHMTEGRFCHSATGNATIVSLTVGGEERPENKPLYFPVDAPTCGQKIWVLAEIITL